MTAPRSKTAPAPLLKDAEHGGPPTLREYLAGHLAIARLDHWVKNIFILPGVLVARSLGAEANLLSWPTVLGLLAVCLTSSSNYVLNELVDAPFDRFHPTKQQRPVPRGHVNVPLAYGQWLALQAVAVALASMVGGTLVGSVVALWAMGLLYNVPPVRLKDLPYFDVLSEAVNNPIRLAAGWYIAGGHLYLPVTLLISYWMVGCYFMTVKRYAELRMFHDQAARASYRKSFSFYTEARLLVAMMFFSSASMLFFGAFIMRYRMELILSFPFLALVMAVYLALAFRHDSAAQAPEKLWREPLLVVATAVCAAVMLTCLVVNVPSLHRLFPQTSLSQRR
jgi:4-hydroxybenzoate polyprenyltransferase